MNGAVWISPIKKLPPVINAVHATSSINYTKEPQALHGVQSLKVQGGVSFLSSNLIANNPEKPTFENFIVLNASDERISERRLSSLYKQFNGLRKNKRNPNIINRTEPVKIYENLITVSTLQYYFHNHCMTGAAYRILLSELSQLGLH
ncbi:unnamed protein product [Caenorhabditis angaria]|uniref:Uncharacterized protein n=1 Tax=Caenorhabditis angaria TaxID=860376 RepID=A0A9P1NAD6_9PELO|nr:unnamed protein product [Caenorhabditis angaria]